MYLMLNVNLYAKDQKLDGKQMLSKQDLLTESYSQSWRVYIC